MVLWFNTRGRTLSFWKKQSATTEKRSTRRSTNISVYVFPPDSTSFVHDEFIQYSLIICGWGSQITSSKPDSISREIYKKYKMANRRTDLEKSSAILKHQALYKDNTSPWKETYRKVNIGGWEGVFKMDGYFLILWQNENESLILLVGKVWSHTILYKCVYVTFKYGRKNDILYGKPS